MRRSVAIRLASAALAFALGSAVAASAQPIGTFSWQLQPYCNIVTLAVVQVGSVYTLDGWDDQCGGASPRAPIVGSAAANPDGTIGLGLNIVTTPGGVPVHVDATVTLPSINGTWRDSAGRTGAFIFGAGSPGLTPRPGGGIGAAAINPGQVQQRVTGACSTGLSMTGVNQDGTVTCAATGGGDITAVTAGTGLSGGGPSGDVSLAVNFGGPGGAAAAARADHRHEAAGFGTAIGANALAGQTSATGNIAVGYNALGSATTSGDNVAIGNNSLGNMTTGPGHNTAIGREALHFNTVGHNNTATGSLALVANTTGFYNAAIGSRALFGNTTGTENTAIGTQALELNVDGSGNTAVGVTALHDSVSGFSNAALGYHALGEVTTGFNNVGLGTNAGLGVKVGHDNIYIGYGTSADSSSETSTTRIGSNQTRAFVDGIRGRTTDVADAIAVLIDSNGQLGTISSSRRYKDHIEDLGDASRAIFKLRPVQFTYKRPFADGSTPVQYGLIAEEVDQVLPELVSRGRDGEIETVKYHILPTLLLAEVQRLERERTALTRQVADQAAAFANQAAALADLRAIVEELRVRQR